VDRAFLERWSREWVVAHDPARDRPMDEAVRAGWLGFEPATEEQVLAAEARLGRRLPPSLRSFLLITNGWKDAGNFIYRLAGTDELAWLGTTGDVHWADAYQDEVVARSLRLSLAGDASVLFLDPMDIGADGEWAAYRLASWSGVGPERFDSFTDLMLSLYSGFHALRRPPGETRDHWEAEVDRARRAALAGEVDRPAEILAQAESFGSVRARLLRFQLHAMRGDFFTVPLSWLFLPDLPVDDPFVAAELVPLLFAPDRLTHAVPSIEGLRSGPFRHLVEQYEICRAEPGFRPEFGNQEFDRLVREIVDGLPAAPAPADRPARPLDPGAPAPDGVRRVAIVIAEHPGQSPAGWPGREASERAEQAWREQLDAAWPRLLAAMQAWQPVSDLHIAPVVLFTDPRLATMLTTSRGRELLQTPRG
jgi:hypothetical protein